VLPLLIEIGHLARMRGHARPARQIFVALDEAFPRRAFPVLGLALLALDRGDHAAAARLCQAALVRVPDHALAWLWLGISQYGMAAPHAARAAFLHAAASRDAVAARTAQAFLARLTQVPDEERRA